MAACTTEQHTTSLHCGANFSHSTSRDGVQDRNEFDDGMRSHEGFGREFRGGGRGRGFRPDFGHGDRPWRGPPRGGPRGFRGGVRGHERGGGGRLMDIGRGGPPVFPHRGGGREPRGRWFRGRSGGGGSHAEKSSHDAAFRSRSDADGLMIRGNRGDCFGDSPDAGVGADGDNKTMEIDEAQDARAGGDAMYSSPVNLSTGAASVDCDMTEGSGISKNDIIISPCEEEIANTMSGAQAAADTASNKVTTVTPRKKTSRKKPQTAGAQKSGAGGNNSQNLPSGSGDAMGQSSGGSAPASRKKSKSISMDSTEGGDPGGASGPPTGGGDIPRNMTFTTGDFDPLEFELRRCLPPQMPRRANDVYVTKRTAFPAQLKKCQKLLDHPVKGRFDEIWIHGLGAAIDRALNLSLQLKSRYAGSVELAMSTSTCHVTDELIPLMDEGDFRYKSRKISAVHVRVFRPPAADATRGQRSGGDA